MKSNRAAAPLFATVNVTGICNLRCSYCFFQPRLERNMALEDFEHVIDQLARAQVFFLNISGGEPFAHPQIDQLLRFAHRRFQHINVLTNGTLLKPKHVAAIADIVATKQAFPVQVSLDAVDAAINAQTRGATTKVLRNLRTLSELGANIVVAMVLTRSNVDRAVESIRRLSEYTRHFHVMEVQKVRALNGTDSELGIPKERLDRAWRDIQAIRDELGLYVEIPLEAPDEDLGCACGPQCMAGFSHIVIDPDLKVRPCDRCVETYVGDLTYQSLEEIWASDLVHRVLSSPIVFCQRDDQRIDQDYAVVQPLKQARDLKKILAVQPG
jgi:MoaA/NifB/PqqE/SkfB family radical SAM enzyme